MLAGVLKPTAGDAPIEGISIARDPEGAKPAIAYMSQRFGLYGDLTVAENLAFYADLYRVPAAERRDRLERLYAFSASPLQEPPGRAPVGRDEAEARPRRRLVHTAAAPPARRADLRRGSDLAPGLVADRARDGVGRHDRLVSTPYMDEAERFDRVALLHRGRIGPRHAGGAGGEPRRARWRRRGEPVRPSARLAPPWRACGRQPSSATSAPDGRAWSRDGSSILDALARAGLTVGAAGRSSPRSRTSSSTSWAAFRIRHEPAVDAMKTTRGLAVEVRS